MTLYSWFVRITKGRKKNTNANKLLDNTQYMKNYTMWPTAKIKPIETNSQKQNIYTINKVDKVKPVKEKLIPVHILPDNMTPEELVTEPVLAVKKA